MFWQTTWRILHALILAAPTLLQDDHSEETKAWVKAQNQLTSAYLAGIPERAAIRERVARLWNFEKYTIPFKLGKYYFYSHNSRPSTLLPEKIMSLVFDC